MFQCIRHTMRGRPSYAVVLFGLLSIGISTTPEARQTDRSQPVTINADSSVFDEQSGQQTLSGNVEIKQGSLKINADFIAISLENNAVNRIEGRGSPILFQQQNEAGELMRGEARELIYNASDGTLTLKGRATLSQPGQSLTSERITFDAASQKVSAEGDGQQGRVSIQIQPPSSQ